MVSLRHLSWRTRDLTSDLLSRGSMLEDDVRVQREILVHHDERAPGADAHCGRIERRRFPLQGHMDACSHAQQDALRSPPRILADLRLHRGRLDGKLPC